MKAVSDRTRAMAAVGPGYIVMGNIDPAGEFLNGTPDDVRAEVRRLREVFGQQFIMSPSHEALLPNIPPENISAMAEESVKIYR